MLIERQNAYHFFDCEDPRDSQKLQNLMLILEPLEGIIMINEIQLMPDIFAVLRVLVDQKKERTFIILGSASDVLVTHSAETLAGRVGWVGFG